MYATITTKDQFVKKLQTQCAHIDGFMRLVNASNLNQKLKADMLEFSRRHSELLAFTSDVHAGVEIISRESYTRWQNLIAAINLQELETYEEVMNNVRLMINDINSVTQQDDNTLVAQIQRGGNLLCAMKLIEKLTFCANEARTTRAGSELPYVRLARRVEDLFDIQQVNANG
jgi:hypothetical protein